MSQDDLILQAVLLHAVLDQAVLLQAVLLQAILLQATLLQAKNISEALTSRVGRCVQIGPAWQAGEAGLRRWGPQSQDPLDSRIQRWSMR